MTGVFFPRTMDDLKEIDVDDSGGYRGPADKGPTHSSTNSNTLRSQESGVRSSSGFRSGATLRRVPWQQMPSSCPDGSGTLLYQPPPPPESRRSNTAGGSRVDRTRSCNVPAMAAPYGGAAVAGRSNSSAGLAVQAQAPHHRYQVARSAHSATTLPSLTYDQLLHSSWDGEGVDSPAFSDAGMSCSTLWASPSAAANTNSSSTGALTQQGSLQQVADRSCSNSSGTTDHARLQGLSRGAQAGPAGAAGGQGAACFSHWGVDTQQGAESAHNSSSSSGYGGHSVLSAVSAAPAPAPPAAVPIPMRALGVSAGRSSSSLAAFAASWAGSDLLGMSPTGDVCLQETLASAQSVDTRHALGGSGVQALVSAPLPAVLQAGQHGSALMQFQHQQQQKAVSHSLSGPLPSLDTSCTLDLDSTLALMSHQLTAAHAGNGAVLGSSLLGSSLDALSPGVLPAYGKGPGFPAYSEGPLSGSVLNLQQQLATDTLGYGDSACGSSTSVPISIPGSLHSGSLLPASAGAAAGGHGLYGSSVPGGAALLRNGSSSAMAVAQLKLQQLMAVEQMQQQLQDEVLRLLPLI